MTDVYAKKMLLIDDEYLLEVHNLKRKVNQAVKHPGAVLKLDAPWDTEKTDTFNYINVIFDEQEGLFKMWYVVTGIFPGQYWEEGRKTAYATSKDGIHWEKPVMNMVEINGSRNNNYIIRQMLSMNYNIIVDPSDVAARRYKMTFTVESEETRWAKFYSSLGLAYSADGIIWDKPTHVNPILRGVSDDLWGFLYDPDRRKYLLFTRRVPNLPRDISLYESYDLVNWEDKGRILVGGDEHDPPETYNLHDLATPFFYEDLFLGLLGTMYFLPGAETYTVYNRPPKDWPFKDLGIKDVQLAWSRDGRQWFRPDDRSAVIPTGQPGSPDAGCLFMSRNGPIVRDGETWMYYTACAEKHTMWSQEECMAERGNDARGMSCCMLAKMPEDHWVSLDAGAEEGFVLTTTMAFGDWQELLLNADASGGYIEAELATPYGQVIEGFGRGDCIPVTGDGKDQPLRWRGPKSVAEIMPDHVGGPCIRFYLKNAKLYSFTVTEPDPDGARGRYWGDMRWCDAIKHRSDNWGSASNAPAGGVPPYTEPGPGRPRT